MFCTQICRQFKKITCRTEQHWIREDGKFPVQSFNYYKHTIYHKMFNNSSCCPFKYGLKEQCHISRIFSFPFFLPFYKLLMDSVELKPYKLHYFYLILYSETTDRGEITVTTTVYIRPRSLHFPMLQIYCLPNKFFRADC